MIIRVFHAEAKPGQTSAMEEKFRVSLFSSVRALPGLLALLPGRPADAAGRGFAMITVWDSPASLVAFTGPDWRRTVIPTGALPFLASCTVEHFEFYGDPATDPLPGRPSPIAAGTPPADAAMIIRIFRAVVRPGLAGAFEANTRDFSLPTVRTHPGLLAFFPGRPVDGAGGTFIMITVWDSLASIEAFTGPDWRRAVLPAAEQPLLESCSVEHLKFFSPPAAAAPPSA